MTGFSPREPNSTVLKRGTRKALTLEQTRAIVALEAVGLASVAELKRMLNKPGGGVVYQRGGVTHQASRPGEPPAPDLGNLKGSVFYTVFKRPFRPGVRIGVASAYGRFLEFGTPDMLPRPFLRPTYLAMRPKAIAIIARIMRLKAI